MNNEAYTTTLYISEGVGHTHETVVKLLKNSQDLDQFTDLKSGKIRTKGRPIDFYYLNEEQATLLIMLMRNSPKVKRFKSNLAKQFFKQRKMLQLLMSQKDNAQWLDERKKSKVLRLEETDAIAKFVNYATDQGSQNAHKYYMTISKMENKNLFFVTEKFKNLRDVLNMGQLTIIQTADMAVSNALLEGMNKKMHYKDIYQLAKKRVEAIAAIFPPSLVPAHPSIGQQA